MLPGMGLWPSLAIAFLISMRLELPFLKGAEYVLVLGISQPVD